MTQANQPVDPSQQVDDHHRPPDDQEIVYFDGRPQLRSEMGKQTAYGLIGLILIAIPFVYVAINHEHHWPIWWVTLALIVIGLFFILIPWLIARSVRYRISNYRIDYEKGLLGKKIETLELWHVDDIEFEQSFFDRVMGVGKIIVFSNDKTTPKLELKGLPNPRPLFESLKQRVIAVKRQRGVIKMDAG